MEDRKNTGAGTSNLPCDGPVNGKDLDAMSAVELAEELELLWGEMDEDTYDEKIIDAYLDALDRKAPVPEHPDSKAAYKLFLDLTQGTSQKKVKRSSYRGVLKAAIAAVVAVAVVLGAMITAQAAGVDVFGSIARWTKETFSFGEINTLDQKDEPPKNVGKDGSSLTDNNTGDEITLQNTLDVYGITGIRAPGWMPDGYVLENISVIDQREYGMFTINAKYRFDESEVITVIIEQLPNSVQGQVQLDDDKVESFEINNAKVYTINNENNYAVTWIDTDYEYRIIGENKEWLEEIAKSMLT